MEVGIQIGIFRGTFQSECRAVFLSGIRNGIFQTAQQNGFRLCPNTSEAQELSYRILKKRGGVFVEAIDWICNRSFVWCLFSCRGSRWVNGKGCTASENHTLLIGGGPVDPRNYWRYPHERLVCLHTIGEAGNYRCQ